MTRRLSCANIHLWLNFREAPIALREDANRQTDKQTDKRRALHNLLGGGTRKLVKEKTNITQNPYSKSHGEVREGGTFTLGLRATDDK